MSLVWNTSLTWRHVAINNNNDSNQHNMHPSNAFSKLTNGHFQGMGKSRSLLLSTKSFVNPSAPWIPLGKYSNLLCDKLRTFRATQPHVSLSFMLVFSSQSSGSPHKDVMLFRARFSFFKVGICSIEAGKNLNSLSFAISFCILIRDNLQRVLQWNTGEFQVTGNVAKQKI